MNYQKFQLREKIQNLLVSGQGDLLLKCLDTIKSAYLTKQDIVEDSFEDLHIVGFKGTSNINDLLTDLNYTSSDKFHQGFKARAEEIHTRLNLPSRLKTQSKIILTGHSLGAAVALYNFIRYRLDDSLGLREQIKMLICFGMPRIGAESHIKKELDSALEVSPKLQAQNALHFIILKEGKHQDKITTLPQSLGYPQQELLDFVDYYELTTASTVSKLLGIHLHSLNSYRDSIEQFLTAHH